MSSSPTPSLGALLRAAREARGETRTDVALRLMNAPNAVGHWSLSSWELHVSSVEQDAAGLSPADLADLAHGYQVPLATFDARFAAWMRVTPDLMAALLAHPARWKALRRWLEEYNEDPFADGEQR